MFANASVKVCGNTGLVLRRANVMIFRHIEAVKRQETMTPQEVMAGLIWSRAVNSKDHFFKISFYEFPCYFEYSAEDVCMLDVYYVGQERPFTLIKPDYKSVLSVAPLILEWLEEQYASVPPEAKPRRQRRRTTAQPSVPGSPPSQSARRHG